MLSRGMGGKRHQKSDCPLGWQASSRLFVHIFPCKRLGLRPHPEGAT